ncbi:MAG: CocE/NonD family hydrolase, partial [Actinomycetota bacterium]
MLKFRVLLLAALTAALLPAAQTRAVADEVPKGAVWTEAYIESGDGTKLHADVFRPEGLDKDAKTPVILAIGPYFGSGGYLPPTPTNEGPVMRFPELFTDGDIMERGYTYVQVDLRGFGSSEGCTDFGGPGEQMDVKAAIEWAASRPWSNGKVGMWGKSYDGWTGVMGLATGAKGLAAAVIQSPLLEGYRGLFMNGVHYADGWYATPALYAFIDLAPPSAASNPDEFVNAASGTATNPDCYAEQLVLTTDDNRDSDYWKARDIVSKAATSDVPVLWSHGFLDANTKADNFMDVYSRLDGPKHAWFGQYDHVRGNESKLVGRDGFMNEAMRWFERYLKADRSVNVNADPRVTVQQDDGRWRAERQWPPADARSYALKVKPGAYADEPGNEGEGSGAGNGTWSIGPA